MKTVRSMVAFAIALCLALSVCCALADQTLEGDANVDQRNYPSTAPFIHPPFYNVKLSVEVDDNGVITAVKDNGTGAAGSVQEGNEEFWANKNKPYFDAAVNGGLLDKFVGKTAEEVRALDMTAGADAVSGATMVCAAAQEAVLNAFEGRAGRTFLPVEGAALPVESVSDGVVTLVNALPGDFALQVLDIRWGVRNEEIVPAEQYAVEIADGRVTITFRDPARLKAGYYYVNVVDAGGKYRSPSFEGGPAASQAPRFIIDSGLSAGDIRFDGKAVVLNGADMADFMANIQHVEILAEGADKPVEQEIVGHHGTVGSFIALDENGVLNADGVIKARDGSESPLFEAGTKYTVTVAAFGYPELTFAYEKKDDAAEAAALLSAVKGTYEPLFPVIVKEEYDPLWLDPCAAVLGEEAAPSMAEVLKSACNGTIYGQEAVDAFGDGSNGAQFDCLFINGVSTITFDGAVISGADEQGNPVFSHVYAYAGRLSLAGMMEGCLYETADEEAGEFRYFYLMPDTPATTYHLEFRYGSSAEDLARYNEGPYAYWLAAGFPVDADRQMTEDVIKLFCLENMDYSAHSDAALNQLADLGFVGSWKADLSANGEEYANVDLSMTIDEKGHGVTMMNGAKTADFEAYAVDNGEKGDGQGLYVAYSNLESGAEAAPYAFSKNETGQTVLTFIADDGTIRWIKQEAETASDVIGISTAEELAVINSNLSGRYVLTADIDLAGIEWVPIGAFVPGGGEEGEVPDMTAAFTGSFDGQGHTIRNLSINRPEAWAMDLFGCIANTQIGNFTLENARVDGMMMAADVVGYTYCSTVSNVRLVNGRVTAHYAEMGAEGMYGGIAGAGMGSLITGCEAEAEIVIPDGTANAGIVGGGLEMTSVVNCTATGSVTAGNSCYGIGGISGCGFAAEQFTDLTAQNVTITVGDNCRWIGGFTGYAGGYPVEELGMPVTVFTNCRTLNVTMNAGANADGIDDIVGSGFYSDELAAQGAPFDQPTQYELVDCHVENEAAVIEIATAEDLAAIRSNLSDSYVLVADIDLSAYENWEPIGVFQPLSDAPEDAEIPHCDYAFTGRFDGNGHTISNLTITSGPMMGTGLFGCASGTERGEAYVGNFTLENVNVTGCYLVGGAVGLQFMGCNVSEIHLAGENKLAGMQGIGGIVGTGFDLISNCTATADITAIGDDGACVGLIAGGTTMSSIENCRAIGGSINAEGNATWAFGAICGAPWGAPEIKDCTASDIVIRVTGSGNRLVGGLLGFAGTYDPENPARIVSCKVEDVTLEVSDSTDSVGGLVGAGKEMMEGSDVMSSFAISDCTVSGTIIGGREYVDVVIGDPACAVTIACEGGMTIE